MALLISAQEELADGFSITLSTGVTHVVTGADVPANVKNQGLAAVETWVNNWLTQKATLLGFFSAARLTSLTPLRGNLICSSLPITGEWWLLGVPS